MTATPPRNRNTPHRRPTSLTLADVREQIVREQARARFEREWLHGIAATTAYRAGVHRRLELGQRLYGERSYGLPVEELIGEIEEEALDLAAWALICAQATADPHTLRALLRVAQLGALAHTELGVARRALTPAGAPAVEHGATR